MSNNEYCGYMNKICQGDCEWAYQNRHGSDGYCCMRPSTKMEDVISEFKKLSNKADDLKNDIDFAIEQLENMKNDSEVKHNEKE